MDIKKYQTPEGYCIIKSNTYCHSIEYINKLKQIAKQDFPNLKDSEISVKVYNDDRWGKQTGIEFKGNLNNSYQQITRLPYTFN
jgi:hypothetical protein